jgi:hypothetical protein
MNRAFLFVVVRAALVLLAPRRPAHIPAQAGISSIAPVGPMSKSTAIPPGVYCREGGGRTNHRTYGPQLRASVVYAGFERCVGIAWQMLKWVLAGADHADYASPRIKICGE